MNIGIQVERKRSAKTATCETLINSKMSVTSYDSYSSVGIMISKDELTHNNIRIRLETANQKSTSTQKKINVAKLKDVESWTGY